MILLANKQGIRGIKFLVIGACVAILLLAPVVSLAATPRKACFAPAAGTGKEFLACVCTPAECTTECQKQSKNNCTITADTQNKCTGQTCPDTPPVGDTSVFGEKKLENPLGKTDTIQKAVGRVIRIFTGVSGSFALLMFVYGSFLLMTSRGEPARVEKGKKSMTMAVLGLAIIFTAYAILTLLFKTIGV